MYLPKWTTCTAILSRLAENMNQSEFRMVPAFVALNVLLIGAPTAFAQAPPGDPSLQPRPASTLSRTTGPAIDSSTRHILDPLRPEEIERAVGAIRRERQFRESVRFVSISLNEPSKESARRALPGDASPRAAFLILLDNATGRGYEAVVDLGSGSVQRYEPLPEGVQPPIMLDEFGECEEAAKRSPAFRAAMKKRGIDDVSLTMVDAWSAGHYGNEPPEDKGKRLVRALCWHRTELHDNGYARPIDNLVVVVDLNRKEVVRIEDYGVVPLPTQAGNWTHGYIKETQ